MTKYSGVFGLSEVLGHVETFLGQRTEWERQGTEWGGPGLTGDDIRSERGGGVTRAWSLEP